MSGPRRLALGDWIAFEEDQHRIVGFTEIGVRLRSRSGHTQIILTSELVSDPSFEPDPLVEPGPDDSADEGGYGWDRGALWDDLPEAGRAAALELEAHLLEATTGYRAGVADLAEAGEPREQYDPRLGIEARVRAKAAEIGCSESRVWKLLKSYRDHGVIELVDKRKLKGLNPLSRLDPRIIEAIHAQAHAEESESTGTVLRFHRRVQNRLDLAHGVGAVPLPSESTFRRAVAHLLPGRYTFGPAKVRQTTANQPDRSFSHVVALRPGEIVMLDTTRLDVFAYDPITDATVSCELTVALDLFTRSLLAWRITPMGTKAIDIGLIIADAMTPEPMRAGWPETLRFNMMRVPAERLMKIDERLAAAAARPVIYPETILVDHGKPYKSDVVRRACTSLGISFPLGRKGKPTDKPEVEAVFNTIRRQFSEHVAGYKGPDVARRGRDPQA